MSNSLIYFTSIKYLCSTIYLLNKNVTFPAVILKWNCYFPSYQLFSLRCTIYLLMGLVMEQSYSNIQDKHIFMYFLFWKTVDLWLASIGWEQNNNKSQNLDIEKPLICYIIIHNPQIERPVSYTMTVYQFTYYLTEDNTKQLTYC
jgi:hypothetical protein